MKSAAFKPQYDGRLKVEHIAHNDRMSFELFKQIYGGQLATPEEIGKSRIAFVPDGFSVWKTKRGDLLAVRDE